MLYTFKSKVTADLFMLGPNGNEMLRIIGKEVTAMGVVQPADMPAAIKAIEAAIMLGEPKPVRAEAQGAAGSASPGKDKPAFVSLRQRAWPFVEMMKSAHAADAAITWGV